MLDDVRRREGAEHLLEDAQHRRRTLPARRHGVGDLRKAVSGNTPKIRKEAQLSLIKLVKMDRNKSLKAPGSVLLKLLLPPDFRQNLIN